MKQKQLEIFLDENLQKRYVSILRNLQMAAPFFFIKKKVRRITSQFRTYMSVNAMND